MMEEQAQKKNMLMLCWEHVLKNGKIKEIKIQKNIKSWRKCKN